MQLINEKKTLRNELEITHGLLREALDRNKAETEQVQDVADDNEWPEIDITKVLVKPDTKFTYDNVRYVAKENNRFVCGVCCLIDDKGDCKLWDAKCDGLYFTKPE